MSERRLESRFLCADLVRVDWKAAEVAGERSVVNLDVNSPTVEAVLEDISARGACVQVEERIPIGAAISISAISGEPAQFTGWVSYCVYRDYGYFVGIRFCNGTRWSSGVFEPRHLTSLEALLQSTRD